MEILQFHNKRVCMRERHIIGNLFLGKSLKKKTIPKPLTIAVKLGKKN